MSSRHTESACRGHERGANRLCWPKAAISRAIRAHGLLAMALFAGSPFGGAALPIPNAGFAEAAAAQPAAGGSALEPAAARPYGSLRGSYPRLEVALARYRAFAEADGWPALRAGPALRRGDRGPRVTALRARLAVTRDVTPGRASSPDLFDAALDAAVRRFQERHALEMDGVVGPATRAALNEPLERRIRQIELNLGRWRRVPVTGEEPLVVVNIPAFELRVMDGGGEVLRMRAVVGRRDRPTPVLSERIRAVVFNPYWEVPPHIATADVLPRVRRDPGYLVRNGFHVFAGGGGGQRELDPAAIPWRSVSERDFPYRFRQDPGPTNPMGRVKFSFPNRFNVFLHDTPDRKLFDRRLRAFSSGCVRLEAALELADRLLRDQAELPPDRLLAALSGVPEAVVPLAAPVPIHLVYLTTWADEDGTVRFSPDLYGLDAAILDGVTAAAPGHPGVATWPPPDSEPVEPARRSATPAMPVPGNARETAGSIDTFDTFPEGRCR